MRRRIEPLRIPRLSGLRLPLLGFLILPLLLSGPFLEGCVSTQDASKPENAPITFTDLMPLAPQPSEASIEGGLKVRMD